MKLPPLPFKALISSGGRQIETTITAAVRYGGGTLYRTKGCGLVRAEAITPIAVSTWRLPKDPLTDHDSLKHPLSFAKSDQRSFDADVYRTMQSHTPKTERDFWRERTQTNRAWLADILKAGPLPTLEILRRAKEDGIAERSLRRAKRRLGVLAFKKGGRDGRDGAVWFWRRNSQECRR